MYHMCYLRNLQARRAAGDNGGTAATATAAETAQAVTVDAGKVEETTGSEGKAAEKTFTQGDVDKIISQTIAKERAKTEKAVASAKTEAEKLATMTAEQRAEHDRVDREAKLAAREAEINRRELRATALQTLAEKQLPADLAEVLDYGDADRCSASIVSVEKVFRAAVQRGVEERMKGSTPSAASGNTTASLQERLNAAAGVKPVK